jgi:glycosyltransferase involved in cell wall biosynthesis
MFEELPDISEIREAYHIPQESIVVTYTGALIPNKGIALLFDAVPLVCAQHSVAHFIVAGFPVNEIAPYLKRDIFKTRVTVISPLPYFELAKILKMSDIGVDPKEASTRQASGKMLQYMGAGLPVACLDTENNREYLGDGGIYARTATPADLALAIGELVSSRELRLAKGAMNQRRAEKFSWESSAEKLEEIYRDVLNKK